MRDPTREQPMAMATRPKTIKLIADGSGVAINV